MTQSQRKNDKYRNSTADCGKDLRIDLWPWVDAGIRITQYEEKGKEEKDRRGIPTFIMLSMDIAFKMWLYVVALLGVNPKVKTIMIR